MSGMAVMTPSVDEEATKLVEKTFGIITPHWRAILPTIQVKVAKKPFNRVPELRKFCAKQNKQPGWERANWRWTQIICPELGEREATLWVRYNRQGLSLSPADYQFQKELLAVIAKVMWFVSSKLREEVRKQSTGMASECAGLAYMGFRDSFSRFFLNPKFLEECREDAWAFMQRLDKKLSAGLF